MEKGIFYLVCTLVILVVILASDKAIIGAVNNERTTVYVKVPEVVTPTSVPTATPAATLRTVVLPTKAVVK